MASKHVDTEVYEKQMRKVMVGMEAIAGDTETPLPVRLAAMRRCVAFWQALIDELDPPKHRPEAA